MDGQCHRKDTALATPPAFGLEGFRNAPGGVRPSGKDSRQGKGEMVR